MTPQTKRITAFETTTCGRCLGSGFFGPVSVQNGICFGCSGRGWKHTKRGSAALWYYRALQEIPADGVRVGDLIEETGITLTGAVYSYLARVIAVDVDGEQVTLASEHHRAAIRTAHGRDPERVRRPTTARELIRVVRTPEVNERHIAQAVAYQATLTKTGTVRKRRPRQPRLAA